MNARSFQIMVPMRDGTRLNTFVFLPDDGGPRWPAILHRTPYGIAAADAPHKFEHTRAWLPNPTEPMRGSILRGWKGIVEHGYVVLTSWSFIRHYRGDSTYGSGAAEKLYKRFGHWLPMAKMVHDAQREAEYLRSRKEVDGARIGFMGFSLSAKAAVYIAAFAPEIAATVAIPARYPDEEVLTVPEAAHKAGVTNADIVRLIFDGELANIPRRGQIAVPRSELDAWLDRQERREDIEG